MGFRVSEMPRKILWRQIDSDHQLARAEAVIEPGGVFSQTTVLGEGNDALPVRPGDTDFRIERRQGNCHIRQVGSTGDAAGSQDFVNAPHATVRTLRPGLVSNAIALRLVEVITAGTLIQITAARGGIAELGTRTSQDRGHQERVVSRRTRIVSDVRIGHESA